MTITKKVLKKAEEGMKILERTGKTAYIKMRNGNERYIDYIVEKGNFYYCSSDEDAYVYWDGSIYGFTFSPDIFETKKNDPKK